MREIKFRAYDQFSEYYFEPSKIDFENGYVYERMNPVDGVYRKHIIENIALEQYTGLSDLEEGDILKSFHFNHGDGDHFLYHVIIYSEKYAAFLAINKVNYVNSDFDLRNGNVMLYQMVKHNAVKCGNIRYNPELIK